MAPSVGTILLEIQLKYTYSKHKGQSVNDSLGSVFYASFHHQQQLSFFCAKEQRVEDKIM